MSAPKLRFKEYKGDWEKIKFDTLFKEKNIKSGDLDKFPLYSLTVKEGVVPKSERYERSFLVKKEENYKLVEPQDFVSNPMNMTIGAIALYKGQNTVAVSGYYNVFTNISEYKNQFIEDYLKSYKMVWLYKSIATGSLIEKQRVHYSQFKELNRFLPSIPEANRISDFFTQLNLRIVKQQKKVELLKQQKKGLLQKIFSRELRFEDEDGQEYPAWEEVKMKDIFRITRGNVLATEKLKVNGLYPVYSSQTKNNGLMGYYDEYLYENAITWTTDGANAGNTNYRSGKFYCTNVCGVLISEEGYANYCISEMLNLITYRHVSYVGNPKLMNNVMGEIKLRIPSVPEQQKISYYISLMNKKSDIEVKRLELLEEQKKSFMQQMFI